MLSEQYCCVVAELYCILPTAYIKLFHHAMVEHSSAQKNNNKNDVSSCLKKTFEVREDTIIYMNSELFRVPYKIK